MSDEKAPIRAERGMEIVDNVYVYLLGEVSPCASIPITERDVPWNVSLSVIGIRRYPLVLHCCLR